MSIWEEIEQINKHNEAGVLSVCEAGYPSIDMMTVISSKTLGRFVFSTSNDTHLTSTLKKNGKGAIVFGKLETGHTATIFGEFEILEQNEANKAVFEETNIHKITHWIKDESKRIVVVMNACQVKITKGGKVTIEKV